MRFTKKLAPIKVAVFPLLKNKPQLVEKAEEVFNLVSKHMRAEFDDNGNIGKRYRRQDEIGTPHCVVIDFETLGEEKPELKKKLLKKYEEEWINNFISKFKKEIVYKKVFSCD